MLTWLFSLCFWYTAVIILRLYLSVVSSTTTDNSYIILLPHIYGTVLYVKAALCFNVCVCVCVCVCVHARACVFFS